MDIDILKVVGQVSGIGGLSLAILLILFKEIIRKNIFPSLKKEHAYSLLKLITILIWSITFVAIVGWMFLEYIKNERKENLKSVKNNELQLPKEEIKSLSDVILLGRYHFAYESFLVMKLDNKPTKGYEEETLSLFKSLSHKFKLSDSIISSIDKLSKINNSQHLINESTKISHSIYHFLSVNNDSRYAHLYLLAVAKDTYLKLQENDFPKMTLDIFENLAQKQANMLGLPIEMVKNIVMESISYEDIIMKIY